MAFGLYTAKSGGIPKRFEILNPFAFNVSEQRRSSFHASYQRGFQVNQGRVLFLGDSLLQQYVDPIARALNLEISQIDTVTRGGCVLLRGVVFQDQFSDISCNTLRRNIYDLDKHYDIVFLSQSWYSYGKSVSNFPQGVDSVVKWSPFLTETINHFKSSGSRVVVIGLHPVVEGTERLQPDLLLSPQKYKAGLEKLSVSNFDEYSNDNDTFNLMLGGIAELVSPFDLFCADGNCVTHNGEWSFFSDSKHLSIASTDFLVGRIRKALFGGEYSK